MITCFTRGKGIFAFISDGILAAMGAASPKITKCHLGVWQDFVPPLPQGWRGMERWGELVGDTQGGHRGHGGTRVGDHRGHAEGLVGCVEGVGGMYGTQGHS